MSRHVMVRLSGPLWLATATLPWATQAQFTTYPVSAVQLSPLPQDEMTAYPEGFCYCDVTAYSCDSNCCCDRTCVNTEVDLFTTCLPTQPLTPELTFCITEDVVSTLWGRSARFNTVQTEAVLNVHNTGSVQVSLPESGSLTVFKRKASGDSLTRSLLCIVDTNNPTFGTFFEDPETATAAVLETSLNNLPELPQLAPPAPDDIDTYRVGERIPIGRQLNATIRQNGVFSLPVDPYTGFCVDGGLPLGMGIDSPPASTDTAHRCIRVVDPGECVPGGALSVRPFTTDTYLAPAPTALPSIAPAVQTARHPDGSAVTMTTSGDLPEPLLDVATGLCQNVPLGIAYTVLTREGDALINDRGGQIAEVRVDVILGNVTAALTGGRILVQQAFSVKFRSMATAAVDNSGEPGPASVVPGCLGHVHAAFMQADALPTSGSPGYRTGAMLLYGTLDADGTVVERRTTGLPLPSAAPLTGACAEPTALAAPARFGVDVAASCGVPLTPAELRDLCRGGGGASAVGLTAAEGAAGLLPRFGGLVPDARLGAWGSSDASDLEQWRVIDQEAIDDSMAWDEDTATCSRVPAGVRIEILVASVGAASDPQRRVAYARSRVMYRQWQHPWAGLRADNDTAATFAFPLETVVRFVPQEQAQEDAMRRLPPLQLSLPEDFFYPFTSSDTA